uniref:Macaca fascicularis brain cDNA clone: QflA-18041, similar to human hypothetical protein FLJ30002 (FLJ30002), mRNA, RefSeq: NM_152341.2 n=1 Tax=Macaca fascicularis TaxID=9541 RepID=I7GLF4_MACFA|nr:unnamed protein product [Macaca fascicularis]
MCLLRKPLCSTQHGASAAGPRLGVLGSIAGLSLRGLRPWMTSIRGQEGLCCHMSKLGCSQGSNTFYWTWPGSEDHGSSRGAPAFKGGGRGTG